MNEAPCHLPFFIAITLRAYPQSSQPTCPEEPRTQFDVTLVPAKSRSFFSRSSGYKVR